MIRASYVCKSDSIESRTKENDPKITNICQVIAKWSPSLWILGVGGHLSLSDFVCHADTLTRQTRLFQFINIIFCHFHEDTHCWMTQKCFIIEISPWYMLYMVPNVFPLNPGHRNTYKKTQTSSKSVKGFQKEVHHCKSLELVAILDAILDFAKCSRVKSIHQPDFIYVMS